MLRETKLATSCDPQMLFQIQQLGQTLHYLPNQSLFSEGDDSDDMYLVIRGEIFVKGPEEFVIGAGDFLGELGFFTGIGRTRPCEVGPEGATVWRVRRDLLFEEHDIRTQILLSHFLLALAPHINIRLLTVSGREVDGLRYKSNEDIIEVTYDCDYQHRAIASLEAHLRARSEWQTARNVWEFVSYLPFRFGHWHTRASQTLEVGFGTTTSKANLQVALFRALGMQAGYAQIQVPGNFYDPLMPPGLRKNAQNALPMPYDFCVVKLDGEWVPCDGTFTKEALQLLAQVEPKFDELIWASFDQRHGFSLFPVLPQKPLMRITERLESTVLNIDPGNMEAKNILLDNVQGAMYPKPIWIPAARNLLAFNPRMAYLKVLANIIADINRFLLIIDKGGPNDPQILTL